MSQTNNVWHKNVEPMNAWFDLLQELTFFKEDIHSNQIGERIWMTQKKPYEMEGGWMDSMLRVDFDQQNQNR